MRHLLSWQCLWKKSFLVFRLGQDLRTILKLQMHLLTHPLQAGQFAIYGDLKKAFGAVGGVEIAK
jgi:hypothetical protein